MIAGVAHEMPFGAQQTVDGAIRFRLWAPDASHVQLNLEDDGNVRSLDMPAEEDGWFALTTGDAGVGTHYRYRIAGGAPVPDPASRFQPEGVNGPSVVIDPQTFEWRSEWRGRPWTEAVVYELHVGTFTKGGTFASAAERLPYLAELGITAIEVMPVATFAGRRNWGYDGVLPYAPAPVYGQPDDFRSFVDTAHAHGLMVLLDVVYNHFGPEGNYLHSYASPFFTKRHQTPWGDAINYDGEQSRPVRDYFLHNALYWLEEFHLDGLRFDAVHAILDQSEPDILEEIADAVRRGPGQQRQIHLVLENHANEASYLRPSGPAENSLYAAQWNDDFHHVCHTLVTGESDGYYVDYHDNPVRRLTRCLREGFAYQGEESKFSDRKRRGESSQGVPLTAFINFLQNHDQVGNRALGDRLVKLTSKRALRAVTSIMLLNPGVPGLFMGEEFGCSQPFLYFADFTGELAEAVRNGRKREFAGFAQFGPGPGNVEIPDPIDVDTFRRSVLDWSSLGKPEHAGWLDFYRELLDLRRRYIVPGLPASRALDPRFVGETGTVVTWELANGASLKLTANLGEQPLATDASDNPTGRLLHAEPGGSGHHSPDELPPWSVVWRLEEK